jgi:hypothetical protein
LSAAIATYRLLSPLVVGYRRLLLPGRVVRGSRRQGRAAELLNLIGEQIQETIRERKTPRYIRLGPVERGVIASRLVIACSNGKRVPKVLGFEIKPGSPGVSIET